MGLELLSWKQETTVQNELVKVLRKHEMFWDVPEEALGNLSNACHVKTFRDEEIVCRCPDAHHDAFVVVSGVVGLTRRGESLEHVLDLAGPGTVFNIEGLVGMEPDRRAARAAGEVKLVALDAQRLSETFQHEPSVGYPVLRNLARLTVTQLYRQIDRLVEPAGR
jgi:signal-transduction protein with cAMP-binding, CBS, and nucleotidyltransferase domain